MELFLIDAIGPFFRDYENERVNWSKIPFSHLYGAGESRWARIETDLRTFAREVSEQGYNAVTLDDLAHLAPHPLHEPEVSAEIELFREKFRKLFQILHHEFRLQIYLTTDVLPMTAAVTAALGNDTEKLENYYLQLVRGVLDDFPELAGLILRIGESDGHDVQDPIRTQLHLTTSKETNHLLRRLLPDFEKRGKNLILRTWTVGAHRIGDLIWHSGTLADTFTGINSPNFIISMKHGESDFFRYLPLNRAFFSLPHRKIIEMQARREYEGAGEYPSFIGRDCERFARELAGAPNMAGMSVWCQTGGWHRFGRLAFLEENNRDVWIRLNTAAAIGVFKHGKSVETIIGEFSGHENAPAVLELLHHADTVIHELLYIEEFARQKLFFRRVRVPPMLHMYWDCIFINHGVRKIVSHFITDPERALRAGEACAALFPRMVELAESAGLPVDDIEHMRDAFGLILLARRYYFLPFTEEMAGEIRAAKKAYKARWPKQIRQRYRIKVSFEPFKLKRHTIALGIRLMVRKKRGYRLFDHLFTLNLLSHAYRIFRTRAPQALPKFMRESAMGVDVLFK
ncbi:hypothetical protein JIN84_20945 [Luteolibacter yonseiensis]|uniref:Uncharacterized protein n=1 Tax=Luteolibacter yonseiensis TaxID=1144680 RepID=A0A934R478_9BACT|nr:hypothetical protein [Luteolibacter yonseiensis]MBK1818103.1 hypothetical protein [Luteolibacter yonseiensis]